MVDLDKIDDSKKEKTGRKKKEKDTGGGSDTDPFTLEEDSRMTPGDQEIADKTDDLRKGAELNYDKGKSSKGSYKERQIKEVKELHEDMLENSEEYGDDLAQFSLVMHAMLMNFAQNRTGIAQVLVDEFGMNKETALKHTNKICQQAGEKDMFETITNNLTRKLLDTDGG